MVEIISLQAGDALFARRLDPEEWRRILVMRSNPQFLTGLRAYARLIPGIFANHTVLNKLVTEIWRYQTLVFAVYLHETRNPDDPRTGLTITRLQKLCLDHGIASRGRVMALVGFMLLGRFFRRERSPADSRVVHLVPSAAFMAILEDWSGAMMQIVDTVYPDGHLAHCHRCNPAFGRQMRRFGAQALIDGWRPLDPFPEVLHFLARDAAWMLLLHIVERTMQRGEGQPIGPVVADLDWFAASYGVSRSHLRTTLDTAFAAGLLAAPPRSGKHIVPTALLISSFITCMASELSRFQEFGHAARQLMAHGSAHAPGRA